MPTTFTAYLSGGSGKPRYNIGLQLKARAECVLQSELRIGSKLKPRVVSKLNLHVQLNERSKIGDV